LPSFALALAPPPVKQASREYEQALARLSEASSAVSTARQDVQDAEWRDREAARRAAKAGRKPKPPTEPDVAAAVTEAERMLPAAEWEAREKLAAYVDAICTNARELEEAAESRRRTVNGEIKALVDQLESSLLRQLELDTLLAELDKPIGGRHPSFAVRERQTLARADTERLAALRVNGICPR
jgi:chromosome segregation ATPase